MGTASEEAIRRICDHLGNDRTRLLDIVRAVDRRFQCVDDLALDAIASQLALDRAEVEGVVSFYSFLSTHPKGRVVIRLCDDVVDRMKGADEVRTAFETELGIRPGETTPDGSISLERTSCIGMSDQAPSAMVDQVIVNELTASKARALVRALRALPPGSDLRASLSDCYGDGNNAHDLVRASVRNSIRLRGPVIFAEYENGSGLRQSLAMSPAEVIRVIKASRLRGRGGAGFPTGIKWEHTRSHQADQRYIICNADEGEPGTFKDRVILTERPDLLIEGMTIAGYAVGATQGIVYLRAEYEYLHAFLESVLERRRHAGLLGRGILGHSGVDFDIHVRLGAGSYVCGEETALIESLEGRRGQPRYKPPFPAEHGYLQKPTVVNNVETLCRVSRILERGSAWFAALGSKASTGTKLLSVCGDCHRPGIYEVEFGIKLSEVLELSGSGHPAAVLVGGPSGRLIPPAEFDRSICFDDLSTGGAIIVFDRTRDLLDIASQYLAFFIHESCGYCTPCRVGNTLLKERLDKIRDGRGRPEDISYLENLAGTITTASRCGLGWTSPNPVLSTLEGFPEEYERRIAPNTDVDSCGFDLDASVQEAGRLAGPEGSGSHAL